MKIGISLLIMPFMMRYNEFIKKILAVAGTPSKRNKIPILNEAIRLEIMPLLWNIKKGYENIDTIEK